MMVLVQPDDTMSTIFSNDYGRRVGLHGKKIKGGGGGGVGGVFHRNRYITPIYPIEWHISPTK